MFTTRRGLLVGAAILAAAGCTETPAQIITPNADLTAALRTARSLARASESLGYSDIANDHSAHVETIEKILLPNVLPQEDAEGADPSDPAALADAETAGSTEAAESCLATDTDYALLLGEIAACRAAHAAVLA
ncbi:hypothetical protein [Glycomyces buryatensis]|uniref:Uncharacterized protein n=1 Tax=Glycomyces buryatensis TaxID=2570927 RepID=A0A4S8QJR6_9ACTN|nr:hypothetical protein [Glycomyces buryatensis]THV43245.1 hypothetical protein FAB82_01875 [Glycomyces buryatensis]